MYREIASQNSSEITQVLSLSTDCMILLNLHTSCVQYCTLQQQGVPADTCVTSLRRPTYGSPTFTDYFSTQRSDPYGSANLCGQNITWVQSICLYPYQSRSLNMYVLFPLQLAQRFSKPTAWLSQYSTRLPHKLSGVQTLGLGAQVQFWWGMVSLFLLFFFQYDSPFTFHMYNIPTYLTEYIKNYLQTITYKQYSF